MLRVDRLPEVLRSVLGDGVRGAVLMTSDGAALSSCLVPPGTATANANAGSGEVSETNLCAISSSIWNNMKQGSGEVTSTVIKLEEGVLAVGAAGRQHVVALYGDSEAQLGMVRARLDVICGYFSQTFEQLYS